MARRIAFGEPQNTSERWAFDLLERELPDEIEFLTNIDVLSETGQPFEVDAIVLGPYAIHFIDVKGYSGRLRVGKDVWELDGRFIENPLPKANQVAKMFKSRMERRAGHRAHLPWCQGGAFITGVNGEELSLVKDDPSLCAWGSRQIVSALLSDRYVTAHGKYALTSEQWNLARDVAGQTDAVLRRQNRVGDFEKTRRLAVDQGLEVWLAEYGQGSSSRRFLLKTLEPAGFRSSGAAQKAKAALRTEAELYMELSGLAGIPYVAPLIDTGELIALPIRLPNGRSLENFNADTLDVPEKLKILRLAGIALQGIHNRGLVHGRLKPSSIFITHTREVELLDIAGQADAEAAVDRAALAAAFRPWFDDVSPRIIKWMDSESRDLEALRRAVSQSLDPSDELVQNNFEIRIEAGAVIADHFQLLEEYRRDGAVSMWRARHRLGRFDCAVLISEQGEAGFQRIRTEFGLLGRIFHPNVCRVFEAGSIDENRHYIARAWVEGRSLRSLIDEGGVQPVDLILGLARQAASALQYLHCSGVTHRNVRPASIILDDESLTLIDLGMTDPADARSGSLAFRDPRVINKGWDEQSDLYSLALALMCAANGRLEAPLRSSEEWGSFCHLVIEQLPEDLRKGVQAAIALFPDGLPDNYLDFFGLGEEEPLLTELSEEFRECWGISKGYMEFLAVDMLNDGRARSRKQWVLEALRSRHIAGNKTNYGSMNATVSRLFSAGVAEKYGKKVRLTEKFLDTFRKEIGVIHEQK